MEWRTPGQLLQDTMESRGMTVAELARRTGLSQKRIRALRNDQRVLAQHEATALARATGRPLGEWLAARGNHHV